MDRETDRQIDKKEGGGKRSRQTDQQRDMQGRDEKGRQNRQTD